MKADFSPAALADLEEIGLYIARDNPRAAEAWVDKLIDRAEKAALLPRGGRVVPEVRDPISARCFCAPTGSSTASSRAASWC